jgi:hypothetical protein
MDTTEFQLADLFKGVGGQESRLVEDYEGWIKYISLTYILKIVTEANTLITEL